jgi:hypothetical protein
MDSDDSDGPQAPGNGKGKGTGGGKKRGQHVPPPSSAVPTKSGKLSIKLSSNQYVSLYATVALKPITLSSNPQDYQVGQGTKDTRRGKFANVLQRFDALTDRIVAVQKPRMSSTDSTASTPNTETSGVDSPSSATSAESVDNGNGLRGSDSDASRTSGNTVKGAAKATPAQLSAKHTEKITVPRGSSSRARTPISDEESSGSYEETEFIEIDEGVVIPRTVKRHRQPKRVDVRNNRDIPKPKAWNPHSYSE